MMKMRFSHVCLMVSLWILLPLNGYGAEKPVKMPTGNKSTTSLSLLKETKHALESAFSYLQKTQQPNGSWKDDPAITALVVYSYLLEPTYNPEGRSEEIISKGFKFIEQFVKPDGSIYDKEYRSYATSLSLLAFTASKQAKYKDIVTNAKNWLIEFQLDEDEGYSKTHPYYGGIGYGGDDRPDLSNTHFALAAIKEAEDFETLFKNIVPADVDQMEMEEKKMGLHWQKALVFLARCQNVKSVNDMPYVVDNGGFIYETGHYKEERSHSYGSMTYAGVKSLLYAELNKEDIRVKRAMEWIKSHYTLEENPGFGTDALYYYYMTFAKCLYAYGSDVLVDSSGVKHPWREELIKKLLSLQHEEGYWVNENARYWQNLKDLVTAYSVIGIKFALKGLLPG